MHACDNVRQTRELTYVTGHVNTRSHLWKFTTWRFICRGLTVCFLLMSLWLAMVLLSSSWTPWAWLQVRLRSVPRVSPFSTEQWTHIFSQQISKEQRTKPHYSCNRWRKRIWQNPTPLHDKNTQQTRIKKELPQSLKGIYGKPHT